MFVLFDTLGLVRDLEFYLEESLKRWQCYGFKIGSRNKETVHYYIAIIALGKYDSSNIIYDNYKNMHEKRS